MEKTYLEQLGKIWEYLVKNFFSLRVLGEVAGCEFVKVKFGLRVLSLILSLAMLKVQKILPCIAY